MPINRRTYYSVIFPIAAIIYAGAMFIADWETIAVVIGGLVIAALAVAGRLFPAEPGAER